MGWTGMTEDNPLPLKGAWLQARPGRQSGPA